MNKENEAGHNLVFATPERKEWPCVNDEVVTSDGTGIVMLTSDKVGYFVVSIDGEYYQYKVDELQKPKTPEEALRDDIEYLRMAVACDHFVDKLLQKYNITPKD